MSVFIMSVRHRERDGYCNACNRSVGKSRYVAKLRTDLGVEVKLCRPCLREMARIAGDVQR